MVGLWQILHDEMYKQGCGNLGQFFFRILVLDTTPLQLVTLLLIQTSGLSHSQYINTLIMAHNEIIV